MIVYGCLTSDVIDQVAYVFPWGIIWEAGDYTLGIVSSVSVVVHASRI